MRRLFFIVVVAGAIAALSIREYRLHKSSPVEEAYIGGRGATLWSSTAEIRVPVASLAYGQPVQIYQRDANNVFVRTSTGTQGWVSSALLMDSDLWRTSAALAETSKYLPVQAIGHTRARSNLHTQPGRESPVIVEAPPGSQLVILQHAMATSQPLVLHNGVLSKAEDWWLVRADVKGAGTVSGWVLGRLLALDLPDPLSAYQSSEAMNIVAWFAINHAEDPGLGGKPEYLVAATRGSQPFCDFTLVRVYTWSSVRHRYETAFMSSHLCGKLPLDVTAAKTPGGDAFFRFQNIGPVGPEDRDYRMRLTTVRRMDSESRAVKKASAKIHSGRSHT